MVLGTVAGRLKILLLLLAAALLVVVGSSPAFAQDAAVDCANYTSQQDAQDALANDPTLADELDTDTDGQACEDFDFTQVTTAQEETEQDEDDGATARTTNTVAEAARVDVASLTCEELERFAQSAAIQYDADNNQYIVSEEIISEFIQRCDAQSATVIAATIPGGVLANTGGVPVLPLAGVLLLGGGIILRTVIRR